MEHPPGRVPWCARLALKRADLRQRLTFADVAGSGVDVSAWIKNITNNYYAAFVSSGAPQSLGEVSWNVAPPRTYGVTVRYTFGG